jgi:dipeptidyl aminopeptidase/acylaminoacyl peptidase
MRQCTGPVASVLLSLVIACSGAGNGGSQPDTQAPIIALTSPVAGEVQGSVSVTATAEDNQGVVAVWFTLNGERLGSEDHESPYVVVWNTLQNADGEHTVRAVARDAAGNEATTGPLIVTVRNAPSPTGSIHLTTLTTGTHHDPDGYTVLVAGRQVSVGTSQSITITEIPAGAQTVTLTGIAANCAADAAARSVMVPAAAVVDVAFEITCTVPIGEIAFALADFVAYDLWIINTDGTGLRQITQTGAPEVSPAWSPNGSKIAFSRLLSSFQIVVRNMVGGSEVQLTNDAANNESPAWSPDGSKIAFARGLNGDYEIYVMNANGTSSVNLTNNAAYDSEPAWSPDGTKIVFRSIRDGNSEIYVMNNDGSAVTRLTDTIEAESSPAWSPDGTRIAFATSRDGNPELYLMNPDGSNLLRLTDDPATDMHPTWSSDGSRIAFVRQGTGTDLWIMNADGSNPVQITTSSTAESEPAWRP